MRVLMTTDTVGGVWTYALDLIRALEPAGVEVLLATMGPPPSVEQRAAAAARGNLRLETSSYQLEWMPEPWDDVRRAGSWLLGLADAFDPTLIHLNGYVHAALPWQRPTVVVAHSCVLSWWRAVHRQPAPAPWRPYWRAVARGLAAADVVVAPTAAMLESVGTLYGVPIEGRVIYNGRDQTELIAAAKQPYVFSAGRVWDEAKNIAALDAAAAEVPWPVYVAGSLAHPSGRQLQPSNVTALGHLTPAELGSWLASAAIYALPARYEPFGLSAVEAGLAGCALVLGDLPSLREVWDDAAVFVEPTDSRALAAAIRGLIDDPRRVAAMAQRAHARAATYTLERMASAYLALYRQLYAERPLAHRGARCAS